MKTQRSNFFYDRRRRRHWVCPTISEYFFEPWPHINFLLLSNNTLNLCISHPFVIKFLLNKIPNQSGFSIWVSTVNLCCYGTCLCILLCGCFFGYHLVVFLGLDLCLCTT
jgi:hypothetical protein